MHVAHAAVEAIARFVIAAGRARLQMHAAHVVAGVAHMETMAPEHVRDAVVATGEAQREAAGIQQALRQFRIGPHAPHVLGPVGIVVEVEASPTRVVAGQCQEHIRPIEGAAQLLEALIQIGTPEKARSLPAQLVSAIKTR